MLRFLIFSVAVIGVLSGAGSIAKEPLVTVFQNVNVLTMTENGLIERAVVIVADDRIEVVSSSTVELPDGATIIDGMGKTLMPGLADMHVHHGSEEQAPMYRRP